MTLRRALFAAAPLNTDVIVHRGMPPIPGYGWDGRPAWPLLGTQPGDGGGAGTGGATGQGGGQGGGQSGQTGQGGSGAGTGQQAGSGGTDASREFVAPKDQSEFDRMVGERLARERAKYADYDEVKGKAAEYDKTVEAQKTELQKATDKAAAETERATKAEAAALRAQVALEKGLTASQAGRLVGATRDELLADADQLLTDIGAAKGGGQQTNFDAGQQGGSVKPKKGEGGRAAAQRRYGDKAASGASKTT